MTSSDPSAQLNQSAQGTFKSLLAESASTQDGSPSSRNPGNHNTNTSDPAPIFFPSSLHLPNGKSPNTN
ncbi:unnamed protein product [Prunus armeniaca]